MLFDRNSKSILNYKHKIFNIKKKKKKKKKSAKFLASLFMNPGVIQFLVNPIKLQS